MEEKIDEKDEKNDEKMVEVKRQGSILKKKRDKSSTPSEQVNFFYKNFLAEIISKSISHSYVFAIIWGF